MMQEEALGARASGAGPVGACDPIESRGRVEAQAAGRVILEVASDMISNATKELSSICSCLVASRLVSFPLELYSHGWSRVSSRRRRAVVLLVFGTLGAFTAFQFQYSTKSSRWGEGQRRGEKLSLMMACRLHSAGLSVSSTQRLMCHVISCQVTSLSYQCVS